MTRLERTIGCSFRNKNLLSIALTHPSCQNEYEAAAAGENFQRFEFLGDSILNYFIAREIYERFPKADEGILSRLRSILVSRKLLARIARSIRLRSYLRLGEREQKQPGQIREKILADAFEALVAAIYFDRGRKAVERFLLKCFKSYFNQKKLFQFDPNPKSTLQEYTQKQFGTLPVYRARQEKNHGIFTAWVTIKRRSKTKGQGRTKQEAESQAAAALLRKLKIKRQISSRKENAQAS